MASDVSPILSIRSRNINANSVSSFLQKNCHESLILHLPHLFDRILTLSARNNILSEIHKKCPKLAPRAALFNLRGVRRIFEPLNIYNQELMLWKRYRYVYWGHEFRWVLDSGEGRPSEDAYKDAWLLGIGDEDSESNGMSSYGGSSAGGES